MQQSQVLASTLLLLGATASTAAAQAQITSIGPNRPIDALSADGLTAVGSELGTGNAIRWTPSGGVEQLTGARQANGVSGDGSIVLGETTSPTLRSALWSGTGSWQDLGELGGPCDAFQVNPLDLSDDGTVAVGLGWVGCITDAYKWTPSTGIQGLPKLGAKSARANVVSGNGQTIGGWEQAPTGERRATAYWPDGSVELVTTSPSNPKGFGEVWGISQNGTWVTGQGFLNTKGWLYSKATGLIDIGNPPNTPNGTMPLNVWVANDGKTVIGNRGAFGGWRGTIWTESGGMQWMDDHLAQNYGITIPQNTYIADVSADGRVLVGNVQVGASFQDSLYIELWPAPVNCGFETYAEASGGANVLALAGSGAPMVGGLVNLTTTGAQGPAVITALSLAQAQFPILGGTGLLDPSRVVLQFVSTTALGSATGNLAIPADAALAGAQLYFQSFTADVAQSEGLALSNGLELTVCP
jgi:hypothetical protein